MLELFGFVAKQDGYSIATGYVFDVVEHKRSTMALFTERARTAVLRHAPAQLASRKARLGQVTDASIDLRDPNPN